MFYWKNLTVLGDQGSWDWHVVSSGEGLMLLSLIISHLTLDMGPASKGFLGSVQKQRKVKTGSSECSQVGRGHPGSCLLDPCQSYFHEAIQGRRTLSSHYCPGHDWVPAHFPYSDLSRNFWAFINLRKSSQPLPIFKVKIITPTLTQFNEHDPCSWGQMLQAQPFGKWLSKWEFGIGSQISRSLMRLWHGHRCRPGNALQWPQGRCTGISVPPGTTTAGILQLHPLLCPPPGLYKLLISWKLAVRIPRVSVSNCYSLKLLWAGEILTRCQLW